MQWHKTIIADIKINKSCQQDKFTTRVAKKKIKKESKFSTVKYSFKTVKYSRAIFTLN